MQDRIFLNSDGYVEVVLVGDQSAEMFESLYTDFLPIREKLASEGKPIYGLFDCSGETGFSLSSNKAALEIFEKSQYDRIAMYNVPHAKVTEGIIMAAGVGDIVKIFGDRNDAEAWLKT